MLTREAIIERGRELGFEDVGFTTAEPWQRRWGSSCRQA